MKKLLPRLNVIFLVLLIIIIPISWPLFWDGFFSFHDETRMVDVYQMIRAFQTQGFPPRFAPDLNFGLGHPFFNFYYHLPYYFTSLFYFLGFAMTTSLKLVMFVSILAATFGFYFLAKRHVGNQAALVGATIYVYSPYLAVDLYVRGSIGELTLFGLLPWSLLAVNLLINKTNAKNLFFASILIALLSLAHNILNIFVYPIIFLYGLVLTITYKKIKRIWFLIAAFFTGAALSSYYLIPALAERQFISNYEQIKFEDHFPFIKQLIIPHWGYGISHWGPGDDMSFQIGIASLIAVITVLMVVKFLKYPLKNLAVYFLIIFGVFVFLMNQRSQFFWTLHPILRFVQFPWRMLLFTSLASAFLGAIAADFILTKMIKSKIYIYTLILILGVALLSVWYFKPSQFKDISDERYLELYFANRTLKDNGERAHLSKEYLNFTEDFIPPTIYQQKRLDDLPKTLIESEYPSNIKYTKENLSYDIDVDTLKENTLIIYSGYFPGWTASVDEKKVPVYPKTEYGLVALDIEPGDHKVKIEFKDTIIRRIANVISLLSVIFLGGILLVGFKKNK